MADVASSSFQHLNLLTEEVESNIPSSPAQEGGLIPLGEPERIQESEESATAQDPEASTETHLCPECDTLLEHDFAVVHDVKDLHFCPNCQLPLVVVAGKYKLQKRLGEGGHGVVYLAKHEQLHIYSQRVVKILKPAFFEEQTASKRFLREVQVTSSVSQYNDHIVRVYDDFGEIPNLGLYYVMEYLEGKTLEEYLLAGEYYASVVMDIFLQLCEAVDAAHQAGIVHRDLKPANIFLVERTNSPHFVKVMDFGVAKFMNCGSPRLTRGSHIPGTPTYMSPEQFKGETVDHRTDIYSLGVLLFEMLVGVPPFVPLQGPRPSMLSIARSHLNEAPPWPSSVVPDRRIPSVLEDIVMRALAKSPEHRFQSVREILQILEDSLPTRTPVPSSILRELEARQIAAAAAVASGKQEYKELQEEPSHIRLEQQEQYGDTVAEIQKIHIQEQNASSLEGTDMMQTIAEQREGKVPVATTRTVRSKKLKPRVRSSFYIENDELHFSTINGDDGGATEEERETVRSQQTTDLDKTASHPMVSDLQDVLQQYSREQAEPNIVETPMSKLPEQIAQRPPVQASFLLPPAEPLLATPPTKQSLSQALVQAGKRPYAGSLTESSDQTTIQPHNATKNRVERISVSLGQRQSPATSDAEHLVSFDTAFEFVEETAFEFIEESAKPVQVATKLRNQENQATIVDPLVVPRQVAEPSIQEMVDSFTPSYIVLHLFVGCLLLLTLWWLWSVLAG